MSDDPRWLEPTTTLASGEKPSAEPGRSEGWWSPLGSMGPVVGLVLFVYGALTYEFPAPSAVPRPGNQHVYAEIEAETDCGKLRIMRSQHQVNSWARELHGLRRIESSYVQVGSDRLRHLDCGAT